MTLTTTTIKNILSRSLVTYSALLITITAFTPVSLAASTKIYLKNNSPKKSSIIPDNAIASYRGVSPATINLVKQYEGFRSSAYIDTSGYPVVGYGQSKIDGRKVRMGLKVSRAKADTELVKELYRIQVYVQSKVRVKLTPNQLGALTSLVYNAGNRIVTNSTLIRKLNAGDYVGAANEFPRWNKANQGGRLVPLAGLTKRRLAEKRLFLTP